MATLNETYFRLLDSPANGPFPAKRRDIGDDFGNLDQPKSKYLFTLQLFPRNNIGIPDNGNQSMSEIKLALKTIGRLNAEIHYEDVNYYSYRTKVRTKLNYNSIDVSFYDDITQRSHSILTAYLMAVSPISNQLASQASNLQNAHLQRATIGPLPAGSQLGPLDYIRITHYMIFDGIQAQYVTYDYLNAKIQNLSLDDLDMTNSDPSIVKLTFVFDSINIQYSTNNLTLDNASLNLSSVNKALLNNTVPFKSNQTTPRQNLYNLPNVGQQYGVGSQPVQGSSLLSARNSTSQNNYLASATQVNSNTGNSGNGGLA